MNRTFYYNGSLMAEQTAILPGYCRGVHYGDGVFETMRARNDRIFRLQKHLERLCAGLAVLRIPPPERAQLQAAAQSVLRANRMEEAVLKILTFRDGPSGPSPPETHAACVLITVAQPDREALQHCAAGISARIVTIRRNETSPLCSIKSLNYLDNIIARMQARDQGDQEALFLNQRGQVAEGATSNIFAVHSSGLCTPPLASGALGGITREIVFDIARALSLPCRESDINPRDLQSADELFLTNAGRGIMPLIQLDGHAIGTGRPGPITLQCREAYNELFLQETGQPS